MELLGGVEVRVIGEGGGKEWREQEEEGELRREEVEAVRRLKAGKTTRGDGIGSEE